MNGIRLIPLVILATASMLMLRSLSILSDGKLNAFGTNTSLAQQSTAETNVPEATPAADAQVPLEGAADSTATNGDGSAAPIKDDGTASSADNIAVRTFSDAELNTLKQSGMSESEIKLLLRLRERREQLASKERQLELRENMLKNVETSLNTKLDELGVGEDSPLGKLDENGELIKDNSQMLQLVSMYEAMKPKDAARILSGLNTSLLVEMAQTMKARKMSAILAQMSADAAERLTLALANSKDNSSTNSLPQVGANGLMQIQ